MCGNCRLGLPTRSYRYAVGHRTTSLCDDCFAALSAIGMDLTIVERRVADVEVDHDRRRFRPRWLGRAKVLDHGTVAA